MKYLLGIKKGMTRFYKGDKSLPVTVVDQNGCVVCFAGKGGYEIGIGKKKTTNKAIDGKYKELGYVPAYRLWVSDPKEVKVGDSMTVAEVGEGLGVNVKGVSKGKGFAGVVKRYKFAGGPKTHGQSDRERAPGSIGAGTDPGRVLKGKRMAGRMGTELITVKNKKVVDVKGDYLLVSGAVPGNNGSLVILEIKE